MAALYQPGTRVWVPVERVRSKLQGAGALAQAGSALSRGIVDHRHPARRSYDLTVRGIGADGQPAEFPIDNVSAKVIRRESGTLILRIGDLRSEDALLNPLASSLADGLRLLFPENSVRTESLRTLPGLRILWEQYHASVSNLILIGHGRADAILFGRHWASADELAYQFADLVPEHGFQNLRIISLCCFTGRKGIATDVSRDLGCLWIGPTTAALGHECVNFVESIFTSHFQAGYQWLTAMKRTRESFSGIHYNTARQAPWSMWVKGALAAGPRAPAS